MAIKLIKLKSDDDLIADAKEIRSEDDKVVVGYLFKDPFIVRMYEEEDKPQVLNEQNEEYGKKIRVGFYPWVPFTSDRNIPCSGDWIVTIAEPIEKLRKLYQEKLDGRGSEGDQDVSTLNE